MRPVLIPVSHAATGATDDAMPKLTNTTPNRRDRCTTNRAAGGLCMVFQTGVNGLKCA